MGIKGKKEGYPPRWISAPPEPNPAAAGGHTDWPTNDEGRINRWVAAQRPLDEEASKKVVYYASNAFYSSFHEWPCFPFGFEGFPALDDKPVFGKNFLPILRETNRQVTAYDKEDQLYGSTSGSIHFTDQHPLVKWLDAVLEDEDIIEDLHNWGASPQADYRYRDGNQSGLIWVAGKPLPGPRVENTIIATTQDLDRSCIQSLEGFLQAAGFKESKAKELAMIPEGLTGRDISIRYLKALQEVEAKAYEKNQRNSSHRTGDA